MHVGGTNGKGSTSAFLAAMLRAAGHRVGLYTSPHLVSFTERMQVNGVPAAEPAIAAWTARLEQVATRTNASFFEITTAIAFADFAARGVEIAVIEVGLGGRLDATNIIEPLASGVTRIALEHTEYLGSELAGIAREKAGIAKAGVPFFTTEPDEALRLVLSEAARANGTQLQLVAAEAAAEYPLGLRGPHQVANASLALAMAESLPRPWQPDEEAIEAGLATATVPGRFDRRGPWLFDVAHNPDGVRALVRALKSEPPPRPVSAVVAILKDKAWREMIVELAPAVDRLVLTRAPSAPADRAWDLEEVKTVLGARISRGDAPWPRVEVEPDFAAALELGRDGAGTTIVTGSFHTVGDAMARLPGFSPLR